MYRDGRWSRSASRTWTIACDETAILVARDNPVARFWMLAKIIIRSYGDLLHYCNIDIFTDTATALEVSRVGGVVVIKCFVCTSGAKPIRLFFLVFNSNSSNLSFFTRTSIDFLNKHEKWATDLWSTKFWAMSCSRLRRFSKNFEYICVVDASAGKFISFFCYYWFAGNRNNSSGICHWSL